MTVFTSGMNPIIPNRDKQEGFYHEITKKAKKSSARKWTSINPGYARVPAC